MATTYDQGWAIRRNNSCYSGIEQDCGETAHSYHACCPTSSKCSKRSKDYVCCPDGEDCTADLTVGPYCANSSWVMFNNHGFFCCDRGAVGYNDSNADGCLAPGSDLPEGAVPLAALVQNKTSITGPDDSGSGSGSGSSVSTGTIAGAVVGGVAGVLIILVLVWFLIRKRKKSKITSPEAQPIVPRADKDDILSHPSVKFGLRPQKTGKDPLPTEGAIRTENATPVEIDGSMMTAEIDGTEPIADTRQASPIELAASPVNVPQASTSPASHISSQQASPRSDRL
ncbi:hypothetical protein GGR57DRAFT_511828 [Xylariaceae sp. FL1272]|nr:hypothetical protein GGR57DRAFT_511828 [Xylariaceae sp. FL1272]